MLRREVATPEFSANTFFFFSEVDPGACRAGPPHHASAPAGSPTRYFSQVAPSARSPPSREGAARQTSHLGTLGLRELLVERIWDNSSR